MATTSSQAFEVRAGERQLFLDTAGVAEIENLLFLLVRMRGWGVADIEEV